MAIRSLQPYREKSILAGDALDAAAAGAGGKEMTAAVIIVLLMGIAAVLWACCAVSARTEEMERKWRDEHK